LRSAQVSPAVPASGGGTHTSDGRLWFTTGAGVAVIDPRAARKSWPDTPPLISVDEVIVDGRRVGSTARQKFRPGTRHVQFRFTGVYMRSPERVRYTYKLEGLDSDWTAADERRTVNFNPLPPGTYNFRVRALLPEGAFTEAHFAFAVQPYAYQTRWLFALAGLSALGALYGIYYFRLRHVQGRLALVSQERTRMAREIHDTLAQGLIGISHQLDASVMTLREDVDLAQQHLDLARKMARHSLKDARRSVFDLRSSELEKKDLPATLHASAKGWAAGSRVEVKVETTRIGTALPADVEQNLLRIAQEAVANAVRHAKATMILVQLEVEDRSLKLRVKDDGQGFHPSTTHSLVAGHFGILGMQERAERLGGVFGLESRPGSGTLVEVLIPLG
jgi:signal transduction histidine kinase